MYAAKAYFKKFYKEFVIEIKIHAIAEQCKCISLVLIKIAIYCMIKLANNIISILVNWRWTK